MDYPIEFTPFEVVAARQFVVGITLTNNVTNSIHRPSVGDLFELKQNMVQLLHTNGQFTRLSHDDP